jgi:hypothetical protein
MVQSFSYSPILMNFWTRFLFNSSSVFQRATCRKCFLFPIRIKKYCNMIYVSREHGRYTPFDSMCKNPILTVYMCSSKTVSRPWSVSLWNTGAPATYVISSHGLAQEFVVQSCSVIRCNQIYLFFASFIWSEIKYSCTSTEADPMDCRTLFLALTISAIWFPFWES